MKKFCLIGEKLSYSFSPYIHEELFKHTDIRGNYGIEEISKASFKNTAREVIRSYDGCNVTIPYKSDVMEFLDELDSVSLEIGAVNTIKNIDGRLYGYNTDVHGFGETLEKFKITVADKTFVIAGTGGAAKSVYFYLKNHKPKDIIFLSGKKESDWIKDHEIKRYEDYKATAGDVLINTTPVGMSTRDTEQSPLSEENIAGISHVVDLIYNPKETKLMKIAKKQGVAAVNGLYMLVSQAIRSEEIWNDIQVSWNVKDSIYKKTWNLMYDE